MKAYDPIPDFNCDDPPLQPTPRAPSDTNWPLLGAIVVVVAVGAIILAMVSV